MDMLWICMNVYHHRRTMLRLCMLNDAIHPLTERLMMVMLTFRGQGFKLDNGVASEWVQHSFA